MIGYRSGEAVTQESLGVCRIYREAVLGLSPGARGFNPGNAPLSARPERA
jgi:hypothetical protein